MKSFLLKVFSVWCAIYSSCQAYSLQGSDLVHINPSVILTFSENLTHSPTNSIEAFGFPRSADGRPKTRQRRNAANTPTGLTEEEEDGQGNTPSQIFAYKRGDFNLGGMFAVRFPDPKYTDPCSRILKLTGLRIESMLYAIDFINNSTDILPGVDLGFEVRDDCSNKNRALREALSFVSTTGGGACPDEAQTIGVVGTGSSSTSGPVANLLGLFKVPQVSYSATSSLLSNKKLYPYFMRTVASDVNQAAVMADLAEDMDWNYVAIIHTDDAYGTPGMEHLSTLLEARNVCIAHTFSLRTDSLDSVVTNIVQTLLDEHEISVIFTFCQKTDILRVLNEAFSRGLLNRTWIASDSWGQSGQTVQGVEEVVKGMLGIIPKSLPYENFKSYLANLDPYSNQRNPWYQLTLGEQFNCTFDPSNLLRKQCTGMESFAHIEDTHARFVIDAVFALAYGLHNMISGCQDCSNSQSEIDGEAYLGYVRDVNFTGVTNPNFKFDENGDPLALYEIHNLKEQGKGYSFVRVADWDPIKKFTEWKDVVWQTGATPPLSRCSPDCPAGNFITLQSHKCCWKCYPCEGMSISTSQNSMQCTRCEDGERVDANRTVCLVNPIIYLQWEDPVAIVFVILTSLGLLVTGFSLLVYINHRNSATIKATSTELSYLLLLGIAMNYCCTFLFIATPTDVICSAKILVVGASFSVYVGALLTKTNRISRIFNRKLSDGAPSMFLNIQYQLMFAFGIVAVQIALQVIWFQVEPGAAALDFSDPEFTLLQCQYSSYLGPFVAVGYNALLAMLCFYKAFRIRKLPGQFNDSRGICFAMLTCCLIWFIFFASYFTTTGIANSIICSTAFISCGTSGLICMFLPKLWIVIMRPERNVRQSTMKLRSTGSNVTINTVSKILTNNKAKKSDGLSLKPDPLDMKASSSHSSEGDKDSFSQISNENDDQKFLEEIKVLEEDLQEAEIERDDAVAMANEKYEQMIELQKSQEDELLEIEKEIHQEKLSLRELLKKEGMPDEEIDGVVAMETNSIGEEGNDWTEKINELVSKLDSVSSERDKLDKQVEELKLECQHWKQIMSQSDQDTSHYDTEVEGFAEDTSTTGLA